MIPCHRTLLLLLCGAAEGNRKTWNGLILVAGLLVAADKPQPQPTDTGQPLAVWLVRHPPGSDVDAEGLRDDPRLRVPLTGTMNSPTVPELLARLQSIIHLTMTCEPATPPPVPVFGNPHFHGTPVYRIMRKMAESGPGKGRWQTTADGYHLLLDDPTVAEPLPPPKPPTKRQRRPPLRFWLSLGGSGVSTFLFLLLLWLRLRRRTKPLEQGADKQS